MCPIRVIVIDDSAFMRKVIQDILDSDHRIQVIGTARNGEDGLRKVRKLKPDVVTLDIHMPVMDGITALKEIMKNNPLPVVMLSSISEEGKEKTVQAISNGAVDFITKPSGPISLDITTIKQEIISKVLTAAEVKMNTSYQAEDIHTSRTASRRSHVKTVVAIGTSTGGPRALQAVLTALPADFNAPILIVQHMPAGFTKSLAVRLNLIAPIRVKEAEHGETLKDNTAYIAPGNYHMLAKSDGNSIVIELNKDSPLYGHRPAVDLVFKSVGDLKNRNKIAVILTGMGSDGSEGIKYLRKTDPNTVVIAETEETSIVYGMPKAAVKTKCVNYVVPLNQVSETISNLVNHTRGN
ncbi:chemotaxis response regulator protein-glutamate methylesterase [Virgibacillus profundi]|uniref:Protein-glutamate methylesterase/protein-glutamine glutaminase n=1 Tax=Virgibacillus profundi TaxID=2024555 RepID=A0A2A2IE61_9BACI|nr:chemotaxis response regulator protein-glutamate methylesterase [Virgibacillus profundi]PAV30019.1 chemotaxis response regulator protein-glutamate methylesterase [Virgibacillus profundi]PXY54192.1 chemotaxis response regulator protein-glutamate methylesterase [Virgibacillus profundi]